MGLIEVKFLCLTVIAKHQTMREKDFNNKAKEICGKKPFFFFSLREPGVTLYTRQVLWLLLPK